MDLLGCIPLRGEETAFSLVWFTGQTNVGAMFSILEKACPGTAEWRFPASSDLSRKAKDQILVLDPFSQPGCDPVALASPSASSSMRGTLPRNHTRPQDGVHRTDTEHRREVTDLDVNLSQRMKIHTHEAPPLNPLPPFRRCFSHSPPHFLQATSLPCYEDHQLLAQVSQFEACE